MIRAVRADGARMLRLAAFGATATVLALGAHVLAGGAPAGLPASVAGALVSLSVAAGLSRRARGPVGIGVPLAAVQVVLHEIFMAAAGATTGSMAGSMSGSMSGSIAGSMAEVLPGTGAGHLPDPGRLHDAGGAGVDMLVAHAAAVLLTALLLAHGERLLDLVLAWLRPVPARGVGQGVPPAFRPPGRPVTPAAVAFRPATLLAASPAVLRGPPARTC